MVDTRGFREIAAPMLHSGYPNGQSGGASKSLRSCLNAYDAAKGYEMIMKRKKTFLAGLAMASLSGILLAGGTQVTALASTEESRPMVHGDLLGVDATSSDDVWAIWCCRIGEGFLSHWNGAGWQDLPPSGGVGEYLGMDAISPDDVWVVGYGGALHWDGAQWTMLNFSGDRLVGVSGTSIRDLWVVGTGDQSTGVVWHSDKKGWHQDTFPFTGQLVDVKEIAPNNVWTVGYSTDGTGYIEHWNGQQWDQVSNPDADFTPSGISVLSATDIWLVGKNSASEAAETEHWDGTQLQVVPTPSPTYHSELVDVSATSPTDVWAVGDNSYVSGSTRALTMHWDGASWTEVGTPFPGHHDTQLSGVAAIAGDDVWAVGGHRFDHGPRFQVSLHWNGKRWVRMS